MDLVSDLGLVAGPLDAIPADAVFTDWTWSYSTVAAMNNLLRPLDLIWYELDGVVHISDQKRPRSDAPSVRVHGPTELIRRPVATDEGWELTMFLRPEIQTGSMLTVVDSEFENPSGRVVSMSHEADNWDGPFNTWVELKEAG